MSKPPDNPFLLLHDALWSLLLENEALATFIAPGNRTSYSSGSASPEKEVAQDADFPQLRLVPAGGTAWLMRTSDSTTCIRRFALQIKTGSQQVSAALYHIEWEIMRALLRWRERLQALRWDGRSFVLKLAQNVEVAHNLDRPLPELGIMDIKGWSTVWTCEVECVFNTESIKGLPRG